MPTTVFEPIQSPACGCDDLPEVKELVPVAVALQAALEIAPAPKVRETLPLGQARGRVLAEPVIAQADMPGFDNSGMDGYAVNTADLAGTGLADLPVKGISQAGMAPPPLEPGTVMRIYTGAPIPEAADAVIMQEEVTVDGDRATLARVSEPGEHIRRRGEDQQMGSELIPAGRLLDPRTVAACAGAGAGQVTVWQKLRIGMILTGDELIPAGEPLDGGKIWDVNAPMLTAQIECGWADVVQVIHVEDTLEAHRATLDTLAKEVDLIITSGGVSVGDRDHVKPALAALGAETRISGVAIKPGKPITLSVLRGVPVASLPGNPVSAFVTWHVFGAPMAARMAGLDSNGPARRTVRCGRRLKHKTGRCEYRPGYITGYGADGIEIAAAGAHTHSAQLAPLAEAHGLILVPGDTEALEAGDLAEFLPFDT